MSNDKNNPIRHKKPANEKNPQRSHFAPTSRKASSSLSFEHCSIKEVCKSCTYINDPYQGKLDEKFNVGLEKLCSKKLLDSARVIGVTPSPRPYAYRTHAKLAVRKDIKSKSGLSIGLYEPKTHNVVDMSYCPVHTRAIGKIIRTLHRLIPESGLTPYCEKTNSGILRYISLRTNHLTEEMMLTFVVTENVKDLIRALAKILKGLEEHVISSVHMNINQSTGNAIYGETTIKISGNEKLRESICDLKFEISPTAFFQINPWQAINLYRRVEQISGLSNGSVAWDLYSGSGQISMVLARSGYKVVGIEENPQAVLDGLVNLRRNSLEQSVEFITGRVEDEQLNLPAWASSPEVIVCNPSRRGIASSSRDFLKETLKKSRSVFVYVSCELDTMMRDIEDLQECGHKLRQIEAFDMFAQTDKLEWLAVLTK